VDKQQNQSLVGATGATPAHRPEYFVVIGNGRTGSTWLETTLDQLPDVRARLEIKLRLAYQEPHPMHIYVDRRTRSIKDCILQACAAESIGPEKRPIFGSKLIFDPYGYLEPEAFDFLDEIIGQEIPIIFLKRSYAAQFYSWKVRGVFHKLNQDAIARLGDVDRTLVETVSRNWQDQAEPPLHKFVLTLGGTPLTGVPPIGGGEQVIRYPLENAIEDLLVLFYNDLKTLSLAQRSRRYLTVDYNEIETRLPEIVRFLGSTASETEVRSAIEQPVTARLDSLDPDLIQPADVLERFSKCLQSALENVSGDNAADQLWQWKKHRNWVELRIPHLKELLNQYGLQRFRIGDLTNRALRGSTQWRRRRPIYPLE
jgi:hypothetical protein